jgi:hypothetical protein
MGEIAMAVIRFLTAKNTPGGSHNPVTIIPRGVVSLQAYRRTEEPMPKNGGAYKFAMNIVPSRHPIYLPLAPRPSSDHLRFHFELRRLAYGAGMFVLGILAHMAWLSASL